MTNINTMRRRIKLHDNAQTKKAIAEVKSVGRKSQKIQRFASVAQQATKQIETAKKEIANGKPNKSRFGFIKKLLGVLGIAAGAALLLTRKSAKKANQSGNGNTTKSEILRRTERNINTIENNISNSFNELSKFEKVQKNLSDPNYVWDI